MATYKSVAMRDELQNELSQRLAALSLSFEPSFDASGNPCLAVYTTAGGVAGEQNVFIRIRPVNSPGLAGSAQVDIIGHAQAVFVPHIAELAYERRAADVMPIVQDTMPFLLNISNAIAQRGLRMDLWYEANGTKPTVASVATGGTATFSTTIEPSVQYPLVIGQ